MISCPGCGGSNLPDAKVCEWCGRPFVAQPRRIGGPVLLLGAAVLVSVALLLGVALAITTAISALSSRAEAPPTGAAPTEVPTSRPPLEEAAPAPTEGPVPAVEFVRIANTGGTGAFIRDEPRPNTRGIVAHTDRTVLKIIGPDETVDGRPWRNVEDQRGNRGWTPADFLTPSDVGF